MAALQGRLGRWHDRSLDRLVARPWRLAVIAVPLLAEKSLKSRYDRVLVIDCDPELQRRRLVVRDGSTLAEAQAILDAQASRAQRLALADDVIVNTGEIRDLATQVEALHEKYLKTDCRALPA